MPEGLLEKWLAPGLVGLLGTAASMGTGALAARGAARLLGAPHGPADDAAWTRNLVVGFPLFGTLAFLVALGTTSALVHGALLVAFAVAGAALLGSAWPVRDRAANASPAGGLTALPSLAGGAAVAIALGAGLLLGTLPPYTLDELAYHLAIPARWVADGRATELPLLSHSYFPLGTESVSIPLVAWLGPNAGRASHVLHGVVSVAVVLELVRGLRARAAPWAWVTAAAVATTPALALTAGLAWNDWATTGATLILAFATLDLLDGDARALPRLALALAAGLLTKYTFYPIAGPILAVAWWGAGPRGGALRRRLLLAMGVGAQLGAVFLVRNAILTGNPFAPFLGEHSPSVAAFQPAAAGVAATLGSYLFDPSMADEALGLVLPLLALLGLAALLRPARAPAAGPAPALRPLYVATLLFLVGFAALRPSARLLAPALALLAALTALSWHSRAATPTAAAPPAPGPEPAAAGPAGATARVERLARLALALLALFQAVLAVDLMRGLAPWSVWDLDPTSDRAYMNARRRVSDAVTWANAHVPPHSVTLVLGVQELHGFEGRVLGGGNFDGPRISGLLASAPPARLRTQLRELGVTHVFVRHRGLLVEGAPVEGPRAERVTVLSAAAESSLRGLLTCHARPIAESRDGLGLYALLDADLAPAGSRGCRDEARPRFVPVP